MGMSTRVVGFRPPDKKWEDMLSVWKACKAAGVEPPKKVTAFFDDVSDPENQPGLEVSIKAAVTSCNPHPDAEGFDVDITKLPPDVTIVRFYNSW